MFTRSIAFLASADLNNCTMMPAIFNEQSTASNLERLGADNLKNPQACAQEQSSEASKNQPVEQLKPAPIADDAFVEVMYNTCYGGFSLSDKAIAEYCVEKRVVHPEIVFQVRRGVDRHDPVMVGIVKRLGREAKGDFSNISLQKIKAKYANYYCIDEYDGMEGVNIDYGKYKLDKIREHVRLASSPESSENIMRDALAKIQDVLDEPEDGELD